MFKKYTGIFAISTNGVIGYEKHILDIKDYFENRNSDLCIYDIENDTIDKIIEFLKNDFILNKKCYKHIK